MMVRAMRWRAMRCAAIPAAMLALSGCINLGGAKPPPSLLTLTATAPLAAGSIRGARLNEVLVVAEPETDRRLGVSRVPVLTADGEVAYLKGAQWIERPARLLRNLLADSCLPLASNLRSTVNSS